jgi:uncharacterized cupredoxin-like copper-binding protein
MITHRRLLALTALAGCVALLAAIPALAGSARTAATTINVTVNKSNDFKFILSPKSAKVGKVTFKFANNGQLPHDFKLCSSNKGGTANSCKGKVTPLVSPGQKATLTVTLSKAGSYEYLCTVPGHAAQGMKGVISVK